MTATEDMSIQTYTQDPIILLAAEYLESRGYEFLVDFGYANAVEKALSYGCWPVRVQEFDPVQQRISELLRDRRWRTLIEEPGDSGFSR